MTASTRGIRNLPGCILLTLLCGAAFAQDSSSDGYGLNAGDVLQISVWKEPELSREVLVRPDGKISFPLVGEVSAAGTTPGELQAQIVQRLEQFVPEASVNVAVINVSGNSIYVIGKVARPGEYVAGRNLDVMQALALAGGLTEFAAGNKIRILRRDEEGRQRAIGFRYSEVEDGKNLQKNIVLHSGDVVVVP